MTIRLSSLMALLALGLLLLSGTPATAAPGVTATTAQLAAVEAELQAVDRGLDGRVDDDARSRLRARAITAGKSAGSIAAAIKEQVALLDAQIAGLGPAAANEADVIRAQRSKLAAERSALDAAMRRGGLLEVQSTQLVEDLNRGEAKAFADEISARVASPLTPAFWTPVLSSGPRDVHRIQHFFAEGGKQIARQSRLVFPWPAILCAGVGLLVAWPLRLHLRRAGQIFLIEDAPGHRVRRSGYAIWCILVGTALPLAGAFAVVQGLRWSGLLPGRWQDLLSTFIGASGFAAFAASVTGALLMRSQPSWRIAPLSDEVATRLKPLSWILAGLAFVNVLLVTFNAAVGASRAATIASQAVMAALHLGLIAGFLTVLARIRKARGADDDAEDLQTRASVGLIELAVWLASVTAVGALLLGYVGMSYAIVQFVTWGTLVACATYLLARAADDLITTLLSRRSRFGQMLNRSLGMRGSAIDQIGLILSGFLRALLVIIALGLLLSPFGAGGGLATLVARLGELAGGVEIGGVSISPGTIIRGIVVLTIGLALVRAFMAWLETRYLPVTDLDGSGRNSVSLIARYVGVALAVIWALASLGVGVEKIALLLSALSVGIGFGLQAITQNFISGLILLAERPIKIGDLIRVGDDEGDVKRISVRSTEIELGDHSTLIVPNSELITKSVLNKTLAGPLGRVQIKFAVPVGADDERVRQVLIDAFAAEEAVLEDPPPAVFIDTIADGLIVFNSVAHVAGPRAVYAARSNVYRALLKGLRDAAIDLTTTAAAEPQAMPTKSNPAKKRRTSAT